MIKSCRLLAVVFSFLLFSLSVSSQTESRAPVRIPLRAGKVSVVKGEIQARKEIVYVFSAKAGQKFSGRITRQTGDASFAVTDPDNEALPEEEFDVNTRLTGSLTKTGDYQISVNTVNSDTSKYSLSVKVF